MAHARAPHRPAEARRRDGRRGASRSSTSSTSRSPTPLDGAETGVVQRFTPTIEALVTPDIDAVARRAGREDGVLERLQGARAVVGGAAAVLTRRRAAALAAVLVALVAWDAGAGALPELGRRPDVLVVALRRAAAHVRRTVARAPARDDAPRASPIAVARGAARGRCSTCAGLGSLVQRREARGADRDRLLLPAALRGALVGRPRRRRHPLGRRISVWRGPTDYVVAEQPGLFERVSIAFRLPGEDGIGEHRPARHPLLRALPRRGRPLRPPGRAGPGSRWSACSR